MGASFSLSSEPSDLELIARYKATKNKEFVGTLFQRYRHQVIGTCLKYLGDQEESKDASMDIFEELLKKLLDHEIKIFKSWLHSLAKNHCLMKVRKRRGITEVDIQNEKIENQFVESSGFEHLIDEKQDEIEILRAGIAQLKDGQRQCIELFYLKELSYKDVSENMGLEMNQVKSFIQNGKRNLQMFMAQALNG